MTKEEWQIKAARRIDYRLGKAVVENTGVQLGFFGGVSLRDIADIIDDCRKDPSQEFDNDRIPS